MTPPPIYDLDKLLGSEWIWTISIDRAYHTVARVRVVAFDPEHGLKLACAGFAPEWCPLTKFHEFVEAGVLITA